MYDFAVVGAGPAGSRFARKAAEAGHDVIVLERGEIGRPLACSGHVSRDIWSFTPPGSEAELLQHEIRGARFHVGGPGTEGHHFYADEPISHVIDRVGLDRRLAAAARQVGAEIREQHVVTGIDESEDKVTVSVNGPAGSETVTASMVAGCDGPASRVRAELGLPDPRELLHGVLAFDRSADRTPFVDVHLQVPRFFAWRIPRGDAGVEYGLAAPPAADVGDRFEAFIDRYDVAVEDRCAGAIPIGPPDRITAARGFLIGDAAGQTKPFTGGGIIYGMTAADLAAEHVHPGDPESLAAYETSWRDELGRDIALGRWIRRGYSLPDWAQRLGLRLTSGRIGVHMDRPTTVFSREHLRATLSRSTADGPQSG